MIKLEVTDGDRRIGTVVQADDGTISSQPADLASVVLNRWHLRGMTDDQAMKRLRLGWSNGYWSVRES